LTTHKSQIFTERGYTL